MHLYGSKQKKLKLSEEHIELQYITHSSKGILNGRIFHRWEILKI